MCKDKNEASDVDKLSLSRTAGYRDTVSIVIATVTIVTILITPTSCTSTQRVLPPTFLWDKGPGQHLQYNSSQEAVVLACHTEGYPQPRVTWMKDGIPVVEGYPYEVDNSKPGISQLTLRITQINYEEIDGKYQCYANNSAGKVLGDVTDVRMQFIRPVADDLRMTMTSECLNFQPGTAFHLNCTGAPPEMPVTWYKGQVDWGDLSGEDNCALTRADDTSIVNRLESGGRLLEHSRAFIVTYGMEADQGKYVCKARDKEGQAKTYGTYYVRMTGELDEEETADPKILKKYSSPVRVTLLRDEPLSLVCAVSSKTVATVWWVPSTATGNAKYYQSNRILEIDQVQLADTGSYVCNVGDDSMTVQVSVESEPLRQKEYSNLSHSYNTTAGDNVTFVCSSGVTPKPTVTWYVNNQMIPKEDHTWKIQGNGTRLNCQSVRVHDRGSIQCNISNKHGYFLHNVYLMITDAVETITSGPEQIKVDSKPSDYGRVIGLPIALVVIIAVIIAVVVICRRQKRQAGNQIRHDEQIQQLGNRVEDLEEENLKERVRPTWRKPWLFRMNTELGQSTRASVDMTPLKSAKDKDKKNNKRGKQTCDSGTAVTATTTSPLLAGSPEQTEDAEQPPNDMVHMGAR